MASNIEKLIKVATMQVNMNMDMRDKQEHIEIDIERKHGEGSLPY